MIINQQTGFDTLSLNLQFVKVLKEVLQAEKQLIKVIPCFAKASISKELTATFDLHAAQTEEHIATIMKIFDLLGQAAEHTDTQIKELLPNTNMAMDSDPFTSDISLILAAVKLEKYQISIYNSLVSMAKQQGLFEIEKLLRTILNHEIERQHVLSNLEHLFIHRERRESW
jgi:ferritin-like metal-binding protein YciE